MRALTLLAGLFVAANASAQTTFRHALDELSESLSKEGTSGRIAALTETTAGRRALLEVLRDCSQWKSRAFDGTGWNDFELHLFTRGKDGSLTPRPDRKAEFEVIRAALARIEAEFAEFDRQCDAFSKRMTGESELDLEVRKAWQDPDYRRIKFNDYARRYAIGEDPLGEKFAHSLRHDGSGKLRVEPDRTEDVAGWVKWTRSRVKEGLEGEKWFTERLGWLEKDELSKAFKDPFAKAFVISRLGRADDRDRVQWLLIRYGVLKGEPQAFQKVLDDVEKGRALLKSLSPRLNRIAEALHDTEGADRELKMLLGDPAFRAALAEDILVKTFDTVSPLDRYFDDLMLKEFNLKGESLVVNVEPFTDDDDDEGEPIEVAVLVSRKLRNETRWFRSRHRRIADIAERMTDAVTAKLFLSPLAIPVIEGQVQEHSWALKREAQEVALATFRLKYLEGEKAPYPWRKDREEQAEAILKRAREIAADMARKDGDE